MAGHGTGHHLGGARREPRGWRSSVRRHPVTGAPRAHARFTRGSHRALPGGNPADPGADLRACGSDPPERDPHPAPSREGGRMTAAQRIARGTARAAFRQIRSGSLEVVEPGGIERCGAGEPRGLIDVRSPATWPLLLRGSVGLAESYARGYWDSPDLPTLIRVAARNTRQIDEFRRRVQPLLAPFLLAAGTARANGRRASRKQIAAHYDLGNEMFELMLDPTMTYSCTWFARDDMTLEEAARAKLDLICERLDLQQGDHLLEIGTGWGRLAMRAPRTRGCRVTTTTISREQRGFALARIRAAGRQDQVTVLLPDYLDRRGRFDKLVSVEMIEAVGWR